MLFQACAISCQKVVEKTTSENSLPPRLAHGLLCLPGQLVGVQPGYLELSGGGDLGAVSEAEAKARFAKIVLETKRKREEQFGFELEPEDVRPISQDLLQESAIVRGRKSMEYG